MKYLLFVLALFSIFFGGIAYAQDSEFKPGDLVKISQNSAVYYFGYDGKRHAFPNEVTYFSWYTNFDTVKTISATELASLPLGNNIVVRPGTHMVKLKTNPTVYAVEPKGRLRAIGSEDQARRLYGSDWNRHVVDIPDTFFIDYTIVDPLPLDYVPTGTVVRLNGSTELYVMTNGYTRLLTQDDSFINYHYVTSFYKNINTDTLSVNAGDAFPGFKVALSDTAQTLIDDNGSDILFYPNGNGGQTGTTIPSRPPGVLGNGMHASYYNGLNFNTPIFERIDPEINFDWGLEPPGPGVSSDDFSVRWEGKIRIDQDGIKKFFVYSDDGARLYIDNKLVINNWNDQPATWTEGTISLAPGVYDLRLEYFDTFLDATVILSWNTQDEVIPFDNLYYTNTAQ